MKKELIKANIDNKNICEDFTDIFHDGEFVEYVGGNLRKQAFYIDGIPFEVAYHFGYNHFCIMSLADFDFIDTIDKIREAVKSLNTDNVFVKYCENWDDKKYCLCGSFHFVESLKL